MSSGTQASIIMGVGISFQIQISGALAHTLIIVLAFAKRMVVQSMPFLRRFFNEGRKRLLSTQSTIHYTQNATYSGMIFFPSSNPKFFVDSLIAYSGLCVFI